MPNIPPAMIVDAAKDALAEAFPGSESFATPISFRNGILAVACTNDVIAEEIALREAEFVQAVNDELGEDVVLRIKTK
jgi:hypothetical protein